MALVAPLKSADEVVARVAEIVRPPRRIRPSEAAARYLKTEKGDWDPEVSPYCIEPLDQLASREYQGVVFVGPARTGKSMGLVVGGVTYVVTCSPGDMLAVLATQDVARDWSRIELDRAIRYSPELAARLSPRARDDNTYDKFWRSGVVLKIGWPSATQLSGKTLNYVFILDYDRPDNVDNVDGEGPMWGLAAKRIETFMSRGKCLAESSPGKDISNAGWMPRTPHEAPPCTGILSVYNVGTRARWYWPCQHCGEHFEAQPGLGCFTLVPEFDEVVEAVRTHDVSGLAADWARVACPHCGTLHTPDQKPELNRRRFEGDRILGATWLHDGERIVDGRIEGERRQTHIASYWLGGPAAAYQTWFSIVRAYLAAVQTYARTGDEGPLRQTVNTDQGAPYMPRAMTAKRSAEDLVQRAEHWPKGIIPDPVRFLTAAIDVQMHRFVVHVVGWGEQLERWLIDRFWLTESSRMDGGKRAPLDPAAYEEDWHVLIEAVVQRKYAFASGLELGPEIVLCDSGGREGVTEKAYQFWRHMRGLGLGQRFMLVKGVGRINAPRVQLTWPDSRGRKDRSAGRGDVPVWLLNSNALKDGIAGDLKRQEPGPGYFHVPDWVDPGFYDEMTAETRTDKGWIREGHTPNEAFDLDAYNRAGVIILGGEGIDWRNPPPWATPPAERAKASAASSPEPARAVRSGRSWLDTRRGKFW